MIRMRQPTLADTTHEALTRLGRIEYALGRLPAGPDREPLADDVSALREALERLEGLQRDERHQLGHDLRVPLNTLAGWTHILRLDAGTPSTVQRAVDVFDRNVRALTRLIDTYTADPGN
jgi:signal transduction histidine kinase